MPNTGIYENYQPNSFKTKYPEIKEQEFDEYNIKLNPQDTLYDIYYKDNYKIIEITIT